MRGEKEMLYILHPWPRYYVHFITSYIIYFFFTPTNRIYHKATSADKFTVTDTRLMWTRLNNLKPNSQHVVYVMAIGNQGMSLPSETLVAWTDPALPAFVDVSKRNRNISRSWKCFRFPCREFETVVFFFN